MEFTVPDSTDNKELNKVLFALRAVLKNVSIDNMQVLSISGTTDPTPDTPSEFRHAAGQVPSLVLRQEGDVYVPKNGIGADTFKIKSRLPSEEFTVILIF